VRVLSLNPRYRDAWALWQRLYRAERERREALEALAPFGGDPAVDLWRSQLLVELQPDQEAESLLVQLIVMRPDDPAPLAWLSRLLFEQGRDAEGAARYHAALALAHRDSGAVLWSQVRSIASPAEKEAYRRAGPWQREAFFRLFWARRDPEIRSPENERLGEHFRRLAEARRLFGILHPMARWHRSREYRTVAGGLAMPGELDLDAIRRGIAQERLPRAADAAVAAGFAGRSDETQDPSANLEDGLDDRGRVWVRHGEPDQRMVWSGDAETWRYRLPDGMRQVSFLRRTAGMGLGGEQVVTPVVAGELASARYLLATDRPDLAGGELRFTFWPAAFRSAEGLTELLLFPDAGRAAAVLIDQAGGEVARDSALAGPLRLVGPPGRYLLALDGARGERRGRYRGGIALPFFGEDSLAVSSILVAPGEVPAERGALEQAAPAGLRLRAEAPMRFYAEVYGLGEAGGAARYQAVYRFERMSGGFLGLGGRSALTTLGFTREAPAGRVLIESLVIDPGRLPRGRYRLVLEVLDDLRGSRAASAALEFELR
jgi:GWxTD domain-containing protein